MPVLSYAYLDASGQTVPAAYSHETHALIDIIKRLWSAFHDREDPYAVVCNLHQNNYPAADLAIITEHGLGVIELKGSPGRVKAEGDTWFAGQHPIVSGTKANPQQQVQTYAEGVREQLLLLKRDWQQHERDSGTYVKVNTAVCFTHPDAQIDSFRKQHSRRFIERASWENFEIIKPAEVPEWAARLRFEISSRLPAGGGYRTLGLTWDEIEHFSAGYLDATPWTEIANLMPANEPYGVLILKEQQQRRAIFTLDRDEATIGRDPRQCNLALPGEYTLVSKLHAKVQRIGAEVWLTDKHSTNGTFVDGQRVMASRRIDFGQKIRLGSRVDSEKACAFEYQSPDYLFAGPTDQGSQIFNAGS